MSLARPVGGGGGTTTWEALTDTDTFSGNGGLTPYLNAGENTLLLGGWSYDGTDLTFTTGSVGIGTTSLANRNLTLIKSTGTISEPFSLYNEHGLYGDYTYNGIASVWSVAVGAAAHFQANYGTTEAGTIGTQHVLNTVMQITNSGDADNEYTPHFSMLVNNATSIPGRLWGCDWTVQGPIDAQADLLVGPTFLTNNYNASAVANGAYGAVVVTKPNAGAQGSVTRVGETTYALDALLALVGFGGIAGGSATVGATAALQIGGHASGWMQSDTPNSKFIDGVTITDCDESCLDADGVIKIADNSPGTPVAGMLRYDVTNGFMGYHDGSWDDLGGDLASFGIDGGLFTDTYVSTANVDGGSFV